MTLMRRLEQVWHVIVAVIGWLLFGTLWWWAFCHGSPSRTRVSALVTAVLFSLVVLALDWVWIRHAVWVSGFRQRRSSVPAVHRDYVHDVAGCPLDADWSALHSARYVVINIIDRDGTPTKTYTVGSPELSAEEVAACELS